MEATTRWKEIAMAFRFRNDKGEEKQPLRAAWRLVCRSIRACSASVV